MVALKSSARVDREAGPVSVAAAASNEAALLTSGTATGAGPSLTSSCSVESRGAFAPAAGSVPMTPPAGTDLVVLVLHVHREAGVLERGLGVGR